MKHRLITVLDIALIGVIIVLSVLFSLSFFKSNGTVAEVSVNNKVELKFSLNTNTEHILKTDYGFNKIIVKSGKIKVESADCKDGICVSRGEINKSGESIVCLPHKMIIEIK